MAVLIWKKDTQGKMIGRCDARCYNSTNPECECICGGINHAVGLPMAVGRTFEHLEQLEALDGVQVASRIKNLTLFLTDKNKPS